MKLIEEHNLYVNHSDLGWDEGLKQAADCF